MCGDATLSWLGRSRTYLKACLVENESGEPLGYQLAPSGDDFVVGVPVPHDHDEVLRRDPKIRAHRIDALGDSIQRTAPNGDPHPNW
jgi:hypothetical protein